MKVSVIKQPTESRERTFDLKLEGLSQNEANFLVAIFGSIAGSPDDSGRGVTDKAYDALIKKGAVNDIKLLRESVYIYAMKFPVTPATANPENEI